MEEWEEEVEGRDEEEEEEEEEEREEEEEDGEGVRKPLLTRVNHFWAQVVSCW